MVFLALFCLYIAIVFGKSQFAVVIDAGSTGSRIHVFEWYYNATICSGNGATILNLPEKSVKTRPGIISYINTQMVSKNLTWESKDEIKSILKEYAAELESHLNTVVNPEVDRKAIPIFYLATAGFRQLELSQQEFIIRVLQDLITKWDFLVNKSWISVLDGRKEGLYSWVFLNHLLKRHIGNKALPFESLIRIESEDLNSQHGYNPTKLIEFGGASTQVVFSTSKDPPTKFTNGPVELDGDLVYLKFCSDTQTVFSKSFQGYGRQLALQVFIKNYINRTNSYEIPCLPPDIIIPFEDIQDLAFENIGKFLTDAEREKINSNQKLNGVRGLKNGSYELCQKAIKENLLDSVDSIYSDEGFFMDVVGNENIDYFHQLVAIPRRPGSTKTDLNWFRRRAEILCKAESYAVVQSLIHPDAEFEKVVTGCFGLTFITNFLQDIVNVSPSKDIRALSKIRSAEVSWPAGFVLTEMYHLLSQAQVVETEVYDEL